MVLVLKSNDNVVHLHKQLKVSAILSLGELLRSICSSVKFQPSPFILKDPLVTLVLPQQFKPNEMVTFVAPQKSISDTLVENCIDNCVLNATDVEKGLIDDDLSDTNTDLVIDSNNFSDVVDRDVVQRRRACKKLDLFLVAFFILTVCTYGYLNIFVDDR